MFYVSFHFVLDISVLVMILYFVQISYDYKYAWNLFHFEVSSFKLFSYLQLIPKLSIHLFWFFTNLLCKTL